MSDRPNLPHADLLAALAASEARLRGVLDAGFDAVVVAQAVRDADGAITAFHILDANRRAGALVGQPPADLVGQSLLDVFPRSRDWQLWEQCCRVVITGEAVETTQHTPTDEQPHRWLQRQVVPVAPDIVAISARDVTERQRERLALEASEARHRELFEHNGAVQLLADVATAAIVDANPAAEAFYGWPRAILRTMSMMDLEVIAPEHWRELTASIPVETGLRAQREHRLASGERRQVEAAMGIARIADRRVLHIIVQDVTDRLRAERQLRESEERLRQAQQLEVVGQLAGGIAHDFNNLLTVIRGATTFLRDGVGRASPLLDDIGAIERAVDRASDLTRRLLAVGRRQILHSEPVGLNALLAEQRPVLREALPADIELRLALAPQEVTTSIDRTRLLDALRALIDNARDAMPGGGALTLATARVERVHPHGGMEDALARPFAMLSVRDTGVGMDEPVRRRLFEPFFSTQPFAEGRGMGLAAVHGLVHQARGFIECESAPGAGTVIRLHFPIGAATHTTPADGEAAVSAAAPGAVLLVDDDPMLRELGRRMLLKVGETVHVVASGEEALAWLATHVADVSVLVTDITMPGMSGLDLIEAVRARHPQLPSAAISGYVVNPDTRARLDRLGVPFLGKPFAVGDLERLVRAARRRRLRT